MNAEDKREKQRESNLESPWGEKRHSEKKTR